MNNKILLYTARVVLVILILINLSLIFHFSGQEGEESGKVSLEVSTIIAENTVKDYDEKPTDEQNKIVQKIHLPVRKLGHMAEFGALGLLIFLLLLTWKGKILLFWGSALASVLVFAALDEWHQSFVADRGPAFTDVLIDLSGALITCSLLLLGICLHRKIKRKKERTQERI